MACRNMKFVERGKYYVDILEVRDELIRQGVLSEAQIDNALYIVPQAKVIPVELLRMRCKTKTAAEAIEYYSSGKSLGEIAIVDVRDYCQYFDPAKAKRDIDAVKQQVQDLARTIDEVSGKLTPRDDDFIIIEDGMPKNYGNLSAQELAALLAPCHKHVEAGDGCIIIRDGKTRYRTTG